MGFISNAVTSARRIIAGANVTVNGGASANLGSDITIAASGGGGGTAFTYATFEDQKAANTAGGASVAGSWIARTLNATPLNTIVGASLAANQITLPAGTYIVDAQSDMFSSDAS